MIETILVQLFRASVFLVVGFPAVSLLIRWGRFRSALGQRFAWGTLLIFSLLCMTVPLRISVQEKKAPETVASTPIEENNRPFIIPQEVFVAETKPILIESGNENFLPTVTESPKFSWTEFLRNHISQTIFIIWLIGLFSLWCRRGVAQLALWKILRTSTISDEKQWSDLLEQYGITAKRIPLRITDSAGPALVRGSWFRLSLIVPQAFWDELSPDLRQGVLRHELGHFRHGDAWLSPLMFFLASLQWFNPLAWLTLRRYEESTEWHADEFAYANRSDGSSELAETFLLIHRSTESLGLYMNSFSRYDTLDRVNRLLPDVTKENLMKKLIISTLIVLFLSCGVIRLQLVAKPEATPPLPSQEDRTLECFVKDKDEKPIPDAKVIVQLLPKGVNPWDDDKPIAKYRLRSDENGRIEFTVTKKQAETPGMVLHVEAAHPDYIGIGHIFENYSNYIEKDSVPHPQAFTTITLEPAVKISGTVIDTNGKPAADVHVFAFSWDNNFINGAKTTTRTDTHGKFTINILPTENRWLWVLPNDAAPLTRMLKEDETDLGTLRLEKGVILEGRAVDGDGKPVSDLWLSLLLNENTPASKAQGHDPACRAAVTDKDGRFRFRPLMPGNYHLNTGLLMEYGFPRTIVAPESAYVNLATPSLWLEKPVPRPQLPAKNDDIPFTDLSVHLSDQPVQHLEYRAVPTIDLTLKPIGTLRNDNLRWRINGTFEKTFWEAGKDVTDITKPTVIKIPRNITGAYLMLCDPKAYRYYPLRFRLSGNEAWSNNWYASLGDTSKAITMEIEPYEPGMLKVACRKPDGTPLEQNGIQAEYKNVDFKDPVIITTDGRKLVMGIEHCSPSVEFSALDGKTVMWRYRPVLADEEFSLRASGFDDESHFDPVFQTLKLKSGEFMELIVPLERRTPKKTKTENKS